MFYLRVHHLHLSEPEQKQKKLPFTLDNINLNIQKGEIFGITGPNNGGKTTLLRCIAGLIRPTSGEIYLGDEEITSLRPEERNVSMVFQEFSLYPHLTGSNNINFPISIKNIVQSIEDTEKVHSIARLLHIDNDLMLERKPVGLSTGERQRIAIGKALSVFPEILLLDEPFSNIEENLRLEIRRNLKNIIHENGITAILVSHNQREIGEMCDNIAVQKDGMIEQVGSYQDLYENPQTLFVSQYIGEKSSNFLDQESVFKLTGGRIHYALTIRPSDCRIEPVENSISISGKINLIENFIQDRTKILFIERDDLLFGIELPMDYPASKEKEITINIPLNKAFFFDSDSENAARIYNLW